MENAITTYEPRMESKSISTISDDSPQSKLQVIAAVNSATSLNDYIEENGNEPIRVVAIFTMPGIRKSRQAGAPDMPCQNTYLITEDGLSLISQSDGIYRSVAVITSMFPSLCVDGESVGIDIKVDSKKLKNGNTIKTLVPAI